MATANTLGMIPLLGPPAPALVTGTYPAILIAAGAGLVIPDAGPASCPPGAGPQPAWCEALVQVPGWAHPLRAYSVDLPARSSTEQRSQADHLASRIAGLGELTVAGGNWNSYSRAEAITAAALEVAPLHLRPARMRYTRRTGPLEPVDKGVHVACTACSGRARSPPQRGPAGVLVSKRARRLVMIMTVAQ